MIWIEQNLLENKKINKMMKGKQFEYKLLSWPAENVKIIENDMNELGKSGWELVSTNDLGNGYACFFKREIIKNSEGDEVQLLMD